VRQVILLPCRGGNGVGEGVAISMAGVESATESVLVMDRADIHRREDEARPETGGRFANKPKHLLLQHTAEPRQRAATPYIAPNPDPAVIR